MAKYLDKAGLTTVFRNLKNYIETETGKYVTLTQYNDDDAIRAAADVDLDERIKVFEANTYALYNHNHDNIYQPILTFDNVPTDGSTNPVKSDGIYDALAGKLASSHANEKATTSAYSHVVVDSTLNATSTNPVQNKVINTALAGKVDSSHTSVKATNTTYGHVIVDSALNATSTNPVQNKIINTALAGKLASSHANEKATDSAYGHTVIDTELNSTSTNPVQNKVINTALSGKQATGNYTTTSGKATASHVVVFNATTSTNGAATVIKDSGFTIAANVPSGAVFTDEKVSQVSTSTNANYPLLFKNTNDNNPETAAIRYDNDGLTNSYYNPSTNTLYVKYAYTTGLYQNGTKVSVEGHTHNYQAPLTFDDVPTNGSSNPVKSDGIYDALAGKVNSSDIGNAKIFAGTCSTAANVSDKVVICDTFTSSDLVKGVVILVTFDNSNTAGAVLNMNVNNTGLLPLKKQKRNSTAQLDHQGEIRQNETYMFQYDGTNWVCMTLDWYPGSMSVDGGIEGTSTTVCSISPKTLNDILNAKTVTSISMNGNTLTKTDEGLVDLGTVLTSISFVGQSAGENASGVASDYASITTTTSGSANAQSLTITTNATSDSYLPWGDDDDALSTESVVAAIAAGGLFDVDDIDINPFEEPDEENSYMYFANAGTSNVTISMLHTVNGSGGGSTILPTLYYSTNKTTWTTMGPPASGSSTSVTGPTVAPGQKVYFKGENTRYSQYTLNDNNYTTTNYTLNQFRFSGPVYCGGNVMSLLYGDKFRGRKDIVNEFALCRLFADNGANLLSTPILPAIKHVPNLPAKIVPNGSYARMFYGCTSIKQASDLPATRIGVRSYYEMYQGCTSLVDPPTIYAMMAMAGSFAYMFCDCSSLNHLSIRTTNTNNGSTETQWPCTYMLYGTAPNGVLQYLSSSNIKTQYTTNTGVKTIMPTTWTWQAFKYEFGTSYNNGATVAN